MTHVRLERVRGELKLEVALEPSATTIPASTPVADVPIYLPEPPMSDPIAAVEKQIADAKADIATPAIVKTTLVSDATKAKTEITTHWASARVWVAVIAIALAIYLGRHDVGTIITQILPGAKDIVVAFLYSAAIVESANLLANAYVKANTHDSDPMAR